MSKLHWTHWQTYLFNYTGSSLQMCRDHPSKWVNMRWLDPQVPDLQVLKTKLNVGKNAIYVQWKAIFTALEIQQDWIGDVFAFTWILVSEKHKIGCGGQSSASKPTKLWFRLPWPLIVKPTWAGWLMSSCLVSSWNGGDYWASLRGSLEDWAGCCVCIGRCSGKGPLVWNVDLMLLSNTAVLICFLRPLIPLLFHVENGRPCLVFAVIRQEAVSHSPDLLFPFQLLPPSWCGARTLFWWRPVP